MITKNIDLYNYFKINKPKNAKATLTTYIHNPAEVCPNRIRPGMLVLPGGGYGYTSPREGEPIALHYFANSYNCFVLEYSTRQTSDVLYPYQLLEACMAMAYIRENNDELKIDKNHIAAIGFSAGGHLCGMLGNLWNNKDMKGFLKDKVDYCRPDAIILSYPVITSGEKAHRGSFDNLCGENKKLANDLSLENLVTKDSSPAFIWATMDDNVVPVENSLMYSAKCKKVGVPFELHIFENGMHGLSLCTEETNYVNEPVSKWFKLSITWLSNRGFKIIDN